MEQRDEALERIAELENTIELSGTISNYAQETIESAQRKRIEQLEAALQGIATMCRNEKTNLDVVCEVAADQAEQALGERDEQ